MLNSRRCPRRQFLGGLSALATASLATAWPSSASGFFAEQLQLTPRLTEGPFYPDRLPLDQDNDLIVINDRITPAIGSITHLSGRVLTTNGSPLRGVTVEIWQCDANAVYLHSADSDRKKSQQDANFQGYGRFETDSTGQYRFRTIKPVQYPGRPAPHIHYKLKQGDRELLVTQLMIRGFADNERDGVFRAIRDPQQRQLLTADFTPIAGSKLDEYRCQFDLVVGLTPDERD